MRVIALTGRAGSGKDTTAQLLQYMLDSGEWSEPTTSVQEILDSFKGEIFSHYNDVSEWSILKFAWPLYQIVGVILGRRPETLMLNEDFKNKVQYQGLTGRQLLQKIGTECFREVLGKQVWIDIMNLTLLDLEARGVPGVIISDLRFLNEAEFLETAWNATIVKVVGRDGGVPTDHSSESEIENITARHYVYNTGTFLDLASNLNALCIAEKLITTKYNWQ